MPASFVHITLEEYDAERAVWSDLYQADFEHGDDVPRPPLNLEQRTAGRQVLPAIRRLASAQRAGLAGGESREEYCKLAAAPTNFLLVGAPGVGKSHLLAALLDVMIREDLGATVFCAYTGVAVTALPLPAATYCNLTGRNLTPLWIVRTRWVDP